LAIAGNEAEAQLVYTKSDWKLSEFNQLAKNPARVKQVYDLIQIAEGRFLNNIKNSLNGCTSASACRTSRSRLLLRCTGPRTWFAAIALLQTDGRYSYITV
jgi:hypothetical protein